MERRRPVRPWLSLAAGTVFGAALCIAMWFAWQERVPGRHANQKAHPSEFLVGVAEMPEHEALDLIRERINAEARKRMGVPHDAGATKREGTAERGYYRIDCGDALLRLTTNAAGVVTEADCIAR